MIYCLEDDENVRDLLLYALKSAGFEVEGFAMPADLKQAMTRQKPELLLLDIMLPGEDGLSILKKLRQSEQLRTLPVIMLTAKTSEYDKIIGLDTGADDYITKPFSIMELISRVKALLRRSNAANIAPDNDLLQIGSISLNTAHHTVYVDNNEIILTLKEFELLHFLMKNSNIVISRDKIMDEVWGYNYIAETRTVDVHIKTLRQKLGSAGKTIETIRGVGYKIGDIK